MILIIDNFDSFTYNLYQYVGQIDNEIKVLRNNSVDIEGIRNLKPSHIIISPGPGTPKDAGICISAIREFAKDIPILGVCLGHQAIGEAFGGKIIHAKRLMHGKASTIYKRSNCNLFDEFEDRFIAGRYHSLIIEKESLPAELEITAESEEGEIMAIRHVTEDVYGIQFHPESILTPGGIKIIDNFLKI